MVFDNNNKSIGLTPYNINKYDLLESIDSINLLKKDSINSLHDYINEKIRYFNSRYVSIRDIYKLRNDEFNRISKKIIRKLKDQNKMIDYKIKVPNDKYFTIPNRKINISPNYLMNSIEHKIFNKSYLDINSSFYEKIIKKLTNNYAINFNSLDGLKLYDIKECNNTDELIDYINNLSFPLSEYHFILNYIDEVIDELQSIKKIINTPIEEVFNLVDIMSTIFVNIINILLRIFDLKLDIIFGGPISLPEINIILKESFNNYSLLIEAMDVRINCFNENDIINCNRNKKEYIHDNILHLIEFVNNIFNNYYNTNNFNEFNIVNACYLSDLEKKEIKNQNKLENPSICKGILEFKHNFDFISNKSPNNILNEYHDILNELNNILNSLYIEESYYELYDCNCSQLGIRLKEEMDKLKEKILSYDLSNDIGNDIQFCNILNSDDIYPINFISVCNKIDNKYPIIKNDFERFYNCKCLLIKNLNESNNKINKIISIDESVINRIINFYNQCRI